MSARWTLICLAAIAVALTACGDESERTSSGSGAAGDGPAKALEIGVVLPTPTQDLHWSQAWDEAIREVGEAEGVEISQTDNVLDPGKARTLLEQLAARGMELVMAPSFSYEDIVPGVASRHPDVQFLRTGFSGDDENVTAVGYSYHQVAYPQCWLAASLSKTGTIGNVGAAPIPFNQETNEGCRLGAKAANPDIKVIEAFTNDFVDQQKGSEVAQSLVDRGADALFVSGGTGSSLGALALCGQVKIPCTSTIYDNRSAAPAAVVSSSILNWRPYLEQTFDELAKGSSRASKYLAEFQNGGISVTPFDGPSAALVPDAVRADFERVIEDLKTGTVEFPPSKVNAGYQ
jgi:basic membrane protein A